MTIYRWTSAKVWLIIADSRLEREQVLDEHFDGQIICVKALIDSLLDSISRGEPLSQWRESFVSSPLLALTEAQLAEGKQATSEELCEILWARYRQSKSSVLTADFLPDFLERTFGPPDF